MSTLGEKVKWVLCISFLILAILMPAFVMAQSDMGVVQGRITDSTGAVVPNCQVTLRNEATNITQRTTSNSDGSYVLPNILPGTYEITVSANGFSRYVASGIVVDVGQTFRRNVQLTIGSMNAVVKVTAAQALVQTDTSSVGSIVESKQIDQMPLSDRTTMFGLLALAPGVQDSGNNARIAGSSYSGGYNETMDGINDMIEENEKLPQADPSLDSMQEFKVVDTNSSAEYGPGTTQIIISSKQGTNQFHGSLFEYNTENELDARNYFSPAALSPIEKNQYGGSLGGPIKHNKLFFFGSYEGLQYSTPAVYLSAQPTVALLQGNFTGLPTIINPATQAPFPNNQIPTALFSTVSKAFFPYFATANIQTSNPGNLGNNYNATLTYTQSDNRYEGRIDYTISPRDSVFVHYYHVNELAVVPGPTPLEGGSSGDSIPWVIAVNYTRTLPPNATNVFTFGYEGFSDANLSQAPNFDAASLVPGLPAAYPGLSGLPTLSITGFTGIGNTPGSKDLMPATQISDVFTWIRGNQTLKAGFSYLRYTFQNWQMPTLGSFGFTGMYTGNAFADFLLGDLAGDAKAVSPLEDAPTNDRYGFFLQDDWQATPKLTINLGLRYDLPTLYENISGGMSNYYPRLQKLVVIKGTYNPSDFTEPIVEGSTVGLNTGNWIGNDRWQFQPRIGFAYRPLDSSIFIVRGGYGLYYQTTPWIYGSFETGVNPPFSGTISFEPSAGTTPTLLFDNPFPTGAGAPPSGVNVTGYPSKYGYPRTNQWNLTLESQVASDLAFRATYLGSARWDSTYIDPINTPPQAPGPVQPRRPVPAFGDIGEYTNGTTANTQMLELSATRRFKSGLSFQGEYAWTKQIINSEYDVSELTDPQNLFYDRGNDPAIRPQYFIGNYIYYLPFGAGQRFLSNLHGPLNLLLGGWENTGIVTLTSGAPYSVSFDSSVEGWTSSRADQIGDPHAPHQSLNEWFNPAAFAVPTPFTWGTSGLNVYRGPRYSNWDTALMKNFAFTERVHLQFRGEFYNAINHPSFGNPASDISVPSTVGTITSTSSNPRVIQLGLRLEF